MGLRLVERARRALKRLVHVYASWRGVLAAVAISAWGFGAWLSGRAGAAAIVLFGLATITWLVLFGLEVARQDRLRRGAGTPPAAPPRQALSTPSPARTHVLPVRNAADAVSSRLAELLADLPAGDELLVVDAASTDATRDRVVDAATADPRLRLLSIEGEVDRERLDAMASEVARGASMWEYDLLGEPLAAHATDSASFARTAEPRPAFHLERIEQPRSPNWVALMPESAYHVDEMGPLADVLRDRGYAPAFVVSDRRLAYVESEVQTWPYPLIRYQKANPPTAQVGPLFRAVVTLNDWGDGRPLVQEAARLGIPTFAKVEGVQDFTDADTPTERRPYRTAATVLGQGPNDRAALGDHVRVVGSSRLERIWAGPAVRDVEPLAVINLNFTYGVLEDAREPWLASAIGACRAAGLPYTISVHPAEREVVPDPNVASAPIRHLLTRATVLITRFSTVPYESIARGVPFVYHNPHGERVPTFNEPSEAFERTTSESELAAALSRLTPPGAEVRALGGSFFKAQVDIQPRQTSAERAAEVIAEVLGA